MISQSVSSELGTVWHKCNFVSLRRALYINLVHVIMYSFTVHHAYIVCWLLNPGVGGNLHMKGVGMLVVSLRGVHFGVWPHLGCSGKNSIIYRPYLAVWVSF